MVCVNARPTAYQAPHLVAKSPPWSEVFQTSVVPGPPRRRALQASKTEVWRPNGQRRKIPANPANATASKQTLKHLTMPARSVRLQLTGRKLQLPGLARVLCTAGAKRSLLHMMSAQVEQSWPWAVPRMRLSSSSTLLVLLATPDEVPLQYLIYQIQASVMAPIQATLTPALHFPDVTHLLLTVDAQAGRKR